MAGKALVKEPAYPAKTKTITVSNPIPKDPNEIITTLKRLLTDSNIILHSFNVYATEWSYRYSIKGTEISETAKWLLEKTEKE